MKQIKQMKSALKNSSIFFTALALSVSALAAQVTMEGTIDKIVPEKKEIYVIADGKKHEFYFNEKTELVKAGASVGFETMKKAMKVKVTADKVGKRLDPLKVELLD